MIQEQQQNEIKSSCMEKKEVIEEVQCNVEAEEHPDIPVTFIELMKEDEEIYKKLKIPWAPEGMQSILESKCIDSEKENLQRNIKQYKHQIEYMHETNDALVTVNRRLREDLEEVNSHYQELITVAKEVLKRKRQTENQFTELRKTIQELTQQNEELTKRVADLKVDHLKARRKAQALDGIALLAEAAKDL